MRVTEEALAMLGSIDEKVAVVTVAGPYRSGKSFLLNCLTAEPDAEEVTFCVGSTTNPCTRGLWYHRDRLFRKSLKKTPVLNSGKFTNRKLRRLWPQVSSTSIDGQSVRVLFIDTEGIGAVIFIGFRRA